LNPKEPTTKRNAERPLRQHMANCIHGPLLAEESNEKKQIRQTQIGIFKTCSFLAPKLPIEEKGSSGIQVGLNRMRMGREEALTWHKTFH
jgi:hypothetical protein